MNLLYRTPYIKLFWSLIILGCLTFHANADIKLSQIESYLNNLKTMQATFKQWDQNGALTTGEFYLKRPGMIRMNYKAPSKLVILADGRTLFFVDRSTGDLSHSPIEQSPASFLLEANIDFQKDFSVKRFVIEGGKVKLTIIRKGDNDLGELTLVFQILPSIQLLQWTILDAQDHKTIVALEEIKTGQKLHPILFDPSIFLSNN